MNKKTRVFIKKILTMISPKLETMLNYRYTFGEWINWKNPQDLNAYVNVLKITQYYKNPEITMCVDKYGVRKWLEENWDGEDLSPELYGVYSRPEEIEWERFPDQFVVKCNHSCGANMIIKDKLKFNFDEAERTLKKWLKHDYWRQGEIQYKYISKRIIVEEYLGDGENLLTFKFYCFHGEPRILYVSLEEDRYLDYYDLDFNKLPYTLYEHEHYPKTINKPDSFERMIDIARKLSAHFPFVRVDLFCSFGEVYLSELTFVPTGGYMKIDPPEVLKEWVKWF